jgi:hypothetical protein
MEGELYLFGPEHDRSPSVKWYGVTDISLVYAVAARTPEEALTQLNEYHHEITGYDLMMPIITEYPDEIRQQLREKYGERLAVMLIPFSTVEYPSDPDNLTEEQQAAFDRLK